MDNKEFMYIKVCETLQSILNRGDFVVETYNESILLSYMHALGYPLIHKTNRDIAKDFNRHCEEVADSIS